MIRSTFYLFFLISFVFLSIEGRKQRRFLVTRDRLSYFKARDQCNNNQADLISVKNDFDLSDVKHRVSTELTRDGSPIAVWLPYQIQDGQVVNNRTNEKNLYIRNKFKLGASHENDCIILLFGRFDQGEFRSTPCYFALKSILLCEEKEQEESSLQKVWIYTKGLLNL